MQSAAASDRAAVFEDDKVPHVFTDFSKRSGQQRAVDGIGADQTMDRLGVWKQRVAHAHHRLAILSAGWSQAAHVRVLLVEICLLFPMFAGSDLSRNRIT